MRTVLCIQCLASPLVPVLPQHLCAQLCNLFPNAGQLPATHMSLSPYPPPTWGEDVAESQDLPQSCSQLHHPCLYTIATHQMLAKLTYHPSFSKYSYNPRSPPSLHHLYISHVWFMVCCISVKFTFFPLPVSLSLPSPHVLQKKRMFLKFDPKGPSRNNVPIPQDWVGRELLRDMVLREVLSPVSLTSE